MTKVKYDESEFSIEIAGHAGAGVPGYDLVCAAATILMRTLEAAAKDDPTNLQGLIRHAPGYVRVQCFPGQRARGRCREMMRTIFRGYELLAMQYPEYVRAEKI